MTKPTSCRTESKGARAAIWAPNLSQRSMSVADVSLGYFRVDEKGFVRAWDETMSTYLGHGPDEILGGSMEILIPKSYHERHWKGFLAAMSRGAPIHDQPILNVPFRHKDGTLRVHSAREIFLRDAFGNSIGVLAIVGPECSTGENNGLPSPYADALHLSNQ
jgi:PAS domain S-box-containing protein